MTDKQLSLLRDVRLALQAGDFMTAIRTLEQIVLLAEESHDWGAAGRHLGNLALTYYRLGNPTYALEAFQRALKYARQDEDRLTENGLLGNMGNILREVKRYDEALDYLQQALTLSQSLSDTRGRGIWLSNLGLVYDDLQRPQEALVLHSESVKIARELYDKVALSSRLANLGNTDISLGKFLEAAEAFKEAVTVSNELGRKDEAAYRTGIIGNVYAESARKLLPDEAAYPHFTAALDYYGKAMELMRELGDKASEAEVIRSIGNVLADAGQYDDAAHYLEVAQQIFEALGLRRQAKANKTTLKRLIEFLEQN